jgi:alpha-L-arabinofuranosidase
VWVDHVSLMPGDAVNDVRADVFERRSDLVAMSAVSDLANGWPGGIIQAGSHDVFVTPIYSRSADGRTIVLKAVNADRERPQRARVTVRGASVASGAAVERVVADSLTAVNGFATPDAVRITRSSIRAGNSFSLDLPSHSVSVITLTTVK